MTAEQEALYRKAQESLKAAELLAEQGYNDFAEHAQLQISRAIEFLLLAERELKPAD